MKKGFLAINQSINTNTFSGTRPWPQISQQRICNPIAQTGGWLIDWLLEMLPLQMSLFVITKRRTDTRLGSKTPKALFLSIKIKTLHIGREIKKNCEENARVLLNLIHSIKQSIGQPSVSSVNHKRDPIRRQSASTHRSTYLFKFQILSGGYTGRWHPDFIKTTG